MLNKVLGIAAFGRAPKRATKVIIAVFIVAGVGLIAGVSLAAPGTPAPTMQAAQTKDLNGNGYVDGVVVTFSAPMNASAPAAGFSVPGYTVQETQWQNVQGAGVAPSSTQLLVKLVENRDGVGDTDSKPKVHYDAATGSAKDASGTPLGTADFTQTSDGAGPVLMHAITHDTLNPNVFNEVGDWMKFVFSEPVKLNGANGGTTTVDQLKSIDLEMKFSPVPNSSCHQPAGTPTDANAASQAQFPGTTIWSNFPSASGNVAGAIVVDGRSIKVAQLTGMGSSTIQNIAVRGYCGVGVDAQGGTGITDLAPTPNNAVSQDFAGPGAGQRDFEYAPSELKIDANGLPAIYSQDLAPGNGDGYVDAVKVTFDQKLIDSTIGNGLKFTVKNGSETATITGIDTGATAGDGSLVIHVTTPSPWGGGVKPSVSFDGSSCALQTQVPTAGNYAACANSFGLTAAIPSQDGVPPAVVSAKTLDTDSNGMIDHVRINLTEPVAAASKDGWSVGGVAANDATANGDNTVVTLGIPQTAALGTGAAPNVVYAHPASGTATTDAAGAELKNQTFPAVDGAPARLLSAVSSSSGNSSSVDRVVLTFSEPVLDSSFDVTKFTVGGDAVSGIAGAQNDNAITLLANHAGTGHVSLGYTGTFGDLASNLTTDAISLNASEVQDTAKPVVVSLATEGSGPFKAGTVNVHLSLSEPADSTAAPAVKLGGKNVAPVADGSHTNGFLNSDLSKWDGSVAIESSDCSDKANGCTFSLTAAGAKDPDGNVGLDATPVDVPVDTVAPTAVTGESSAAQQEQGAAAIDANKVGSHTQNLTVTASKIAGELSSAGSAAAGTAELLIDGASFQPAVTIGGIDDAASSIGIQTAFADAAALQQAIPAGDHVLSVKLCDAAGNCASSGGVTVTADYTAPAVALIAPNAGSYHGGDKVCIQWSGDSTASDFAGTELRYSLDGGSTYPKLIASGLPSDGSLACDAGTDGAGYEWTVPSIPQTDKLKVEALSLDSFGNRGSAASAESMSVVTTTQTALSIAASASQVVYGQAAAISGSLTGPDGGIAGKQVVLQRQNPGSSAFSTLATVVTDSAGKYGYTFKPSTNAAYRTVFNASGPYLASTSAVKGIVVQVAIPTSVSSTSLRRGQTFTLRGSVTPAKAGKKVQLQALVQNKWKTLATHSLSSSSAFSFTYRATSTVKLLFRVVYSTQDGLNAWNISRSYMVSWR